MSKLLFADGTGWISKRKGTTPPTSTQRARITHIEGESDPSGPPPPPGEIIFGLNSNGVNRDRCLAAAPRMPAGHVYDSGGANISDADGSPFTPGGWAYNAACLNEAGVQSGKRVDVAWHYNPTTVTAANSAPCVTARNFANSVPAGWEVFISLNHEWNLYLSDEGKGSYSVAQQKNAHIILCEQIMIASDNNVNQGGGRSWPVMNPAMGSSNNINYFVTAAQVPPGSRFHWDFYDNPFGQLGSQYKFEGQGYWMGSNMAAIYNKTVTLGYTSPNYGYGVDEMNAPRRCAPKLNPLQNPPGWGPLSPEDTNGAQQAQALTAQVNFFKNAAVKPYVVHFFSHNANAPGQHNQDWWTMGRGEHDPTGGLHQGWPLPCDASRPLAVYTDAIMNSAI